MRGGLTRRALIASGLVALVVAAAFALLVRSISRERDSAALARHSQQVLAAANRLERLVLDIETGQRGFFITGESSFLDPWRDARAAIPEASRELVRLAAVPAQDRRARELTAAIEAYVRGYSVPLVRAERSGEPAARSAAATEEGKRRVDGIRRRFDDLTAAEGRLGSRREERSDTEYRVAIVAAVAGSAGSVILIALFGGYMTRAIVLPIRRAAEMAGRLAGGDLSTRMPETGTAEIGELERSFNTMATSLETSRAELAASRARVVAAADESRRRIERDLHDGAQQRLVSLGLELRGAEAMVPAEHDELRGRLSDVAEGLTGVLEELQELSRGIHPAILSKGGLGPALKTLARRSAVPVQLNLAGEGRLPERVEVAAYYVVSEALTNAAKHAQASLVRVDLEAVDSVVKLSIRDDGVGGADPIRGSGLVGLRDRIEALGGRIEVASPAGRGTSLRVEIPIPGA